MIVIILFAYETHTQIVSSILNTKERRELLGGGFMSGNIDFWTDPHCKESFGVMVLDFLCSKYVMNDGLTLAMSQETKGKLDEDIFETGTPILDSLEFPVNFERFPGSKTSTAVAEWMFESIAAAKIESDDFNQLAADGGSNAIGSIQEFEVVAREEGRSTSTDFVVCFSHQNERSAGYASGTAKFADEPNEELGAVLAKNHEVQVRMHRNPGRTSVYRGVAEEKGREPVISFYTANETRWGG